MKKPCAQCGVAKTLRIIGNKWTIMVLYQLFEGPKRFSELETELNISPRTLSMRLRQLEQMGILYKKTSPQTPAHSKYILSKKGLSLNQIILAMNEWGEQQAPALLTE